MKLLLGTTNLGKIHDYQKYLVHANLELVTLGDLGILDQPLEIGENYKDNALQKAKFYAERSEYPTLADDGGLEVDALDGRPGIESNRWLGPNATHEQKLTKLLDLLEGVPLAKRTARLRNIVLVFFPHERDYIYVEAVREGIIPTRKEILGRLMPGYPYRSILFIPELDKYYNELTDEERETSDHRKRACRELLLKLEPYLF
jgi:XTP/dITP diphosphohydrolase